MINLLLWLSISWIFWFQYFVEVCQVGWNFFATFCICFFLLLAKLSWWETFDPLSWFRYSQQFCLIQFSGRNWPPSPRSVSTSLDTSGRRSTRIFALNLCVYWTDSILYQRLICSYFHRISSLAVDKAQHILLIIKSERNAVSSKAILAILSAGLYPHSDK